MNEAIFQLQANICKAFSHPKRLQILCELKDGERSFSDLQEATGCSKANLSQHLSVLKERRVIIPRRDGQHMFFSVANSKITQACELMHEVLLDQVEGLAEATAEDE